MSEALIDKLSTIDLATLVVLVVLLCMASNAIYPLVVKLYKFIIKRHNKELEENSLATTVEDHADRISQFEENRVNDRKQSLKIQQDLVNSITKLENRLDKIDKRLQEDREREDKRVRAELKDRIGQAYRYHHSIGKWNHMEKEALDDLISEYEAAGGTNSFVHDTVQPESYTWELID